MLIELGSTLVCFVRSDISIGGVSGQTLMNGIETVNGSVVVPDFVGSAIAELDGGSSWVYAVMFWLMMIITAMTIMFIILWRKKILICAAIVREATTVFTAIPTLLVFPVFSTLALGAVCVWFVIGFTFIHATKAESFDLVLHKTPNVTFVELELGESVVAPSTDPLAGVEWLRGQSGFDFKTLFSIIYLYGFFVLYQWVCGMSWTTMSCAVGWWYFFKGNPNHKARAPLCSAFFVVTIFHTGSVAFAAFVIAFFNLLRAAVTYVQAQMQASQAANALVVKLALCCIGCCIACIERTVKMISYFGLVYVATNGYSFCYACKETIGFFVSEHAQVAVNAVVIWLIWLVSVLTAPFGCTVAAFFLLDAQDIPNPMWPAFATFLCAFLMTDACMKVFDCTVTTVFVCCFEDMKMFDGRYMPPHKTLEVIFLKSKGLKPKPLLEEDEGRASVATLPNDASPPAKGPQLDA